MKRATILLVAGLALAGCSNEADKAKELVANELRDPSSAQFRDVEVVKQKDGSSAVCGEVNGKNAYGGYAGFQSFTVRGTEVFLRANDVDIRDGAAIQAQTEAIRADTQYCVLKGRSLEDVEAETNAILEKIGEPSAPSS